MGEEISKPVEFTRKLDVSEARAIERRLIELEPYVIEAAALRKRLANVNRRLGVESYASMIDRQIIALLDKHGGLSRRLLIRDLGKPEHVVKSGLERLLRRGKVVTTERGYYRLAE